MKEVIFNPVVKALLFIVFGIAFMNGLFRVIALITTQSFFLPQDAIAIGSFVGGIGGIFMALNYFIGEDSNN